MNRIMHIINMINSPKCMIAGSKVVSCLTQPTGVSCIAVYYNVYLHCRQA